MSGKFKIALSALPRGAARTDAAVYSALQAMLIRRPPILTSLVKTVAAATATQPSDWFFEAGPKPPQPAPATVKRRADDIAKRIVAAMQRNDCLENVERRLARQEEEHKAAQETLETATAAIARYKVEIKTLKRVRAVVSTMGHLTALMTPEQLEEVLASLADDWTPNDASAALQVYVLEHDLIAKAADRRARTKAKAAKGGDLVPGDARRMATHP